MQADKNRNYAGTKILHAGTESGYRAIFQWGFFLLIMAGPLLQGLYYEIEFMPVLFLMALVSIFYLLGNRGKHEEALITQPLDWAMGGLVLAYLLSMVTAVHAHQAVVGLLQVCSYFIIYWLAAQVGCRIDGFKGLLTAVYLAAIAMALVGLVAALGWVDWPGFYAGGQICSTFQYHNTLAVYLAVASIIGLALSIESDSLPYRFIFSAGNFIINLVIIGTLSRGTWLLYPLALVAFLGLLRPGDRIKAVVSILWIILCAVLTGRYFFDRIGHSPLLALLILLTGLILSLAGGLTIPRMPRGRSLIKQYRRAGIIGLAGILVILLALSFAFHNSSPGKSIIPQNVINRARQTSIQEGSIQERLMSYRDALRIVKIHPLTGSGGGGWAAVYQQYIQRPYYTKELHNYYLKVAVEAGLLGLGILLAGAVLFCRLLIKARHREKIEPWPPMFWGAAAGVILLGAHAAGDFDLSLPGAAFLFFALIGALRGLSGGFETNPLRARPGKAKKQKTVLSSPVNKNSIATTIGLWGITIAVIISASCWFLAYMSGEAGKEALQRNSLQEARSNYSRAALLAPYTPQYRVGLAMTAARMAVGKQEGEVYQEALEQAREAARLEPYGLETRLNLVKVYGLLQMPQQQIEECKALVIADPQQIRAYELTADTLMNAAWSCLMRSDMDRAGGYLLQLLDVRASMPEKIKVPSPHINLAAGQAALLMGHYQEAEAYLDQAAGDKDSRQTAVYWLKVLKKIKNDAGSQPRGLVPEIQPEILRDLLSHR